MTLHRRVLDLAGRPGLPAELERWVALLRLVPEEVTPPLALERAGDRFTLLRPFPPGRAVAGTRLAPRELLPFLRAALLALAAFHERGIPHANLKPANLLRAPSGAHVLLDPLPPFHLDLLGIDDADLRRKLEYGPPEAAVGLRAGPPGDLYRLGVIAWELCAGRHPFRHVDPVMEGRRHLTREVPPLEGEVEGCPPLAAAMVARLCALEPVHRFPDAGEALRALDSGRVDPPPAPPSFFEPPEPPAPPATEEMRRTLLFLALVTAFGLFTLAGAWLLGR